MTPFCQWMEKQDSAKKKNSWCGKSDVFVPALDISFQRQPIFLIALTLMETGIYLSIFSWLLSCTQELAGRIKRTFIS